MIGLLLTIALVGLVVYCITTFIPMPAPFKTIILVIAAVFCVLFLMQAVGLRDVPVPQLLR